jgi:sugar phosphate isomerase/epimerase
VGIGVITTYSVYRGEPDEDALDRLIDTYVECVEVAEEAGVTLSTEPEPVLLIDSLDKTLEVVQAVDSKSFGVTYDFTHANVLSGGEPIRFLEALEGNIAHIHAADNDGTQLEKDGQVHSSRHLPLGEGSLDNEGILGGLQRIGYEGWIQVDMWQYEDIFRGSEVSKRKVDAILTRLFEQEDA